MEPVGVQWYRLIADLVQLETEDGINWKTRAVWQRIRHHDLSGALIDMNCATAHRRLYGGKPLRMRSDLVRKPETSDLPF